MKKLIPGFIAIAILTVSCENKAGNQAPPPSVNLQTPIPAPQPSQQQTTQPQPVNLTQAQQPQPSGGTVTLNPKHGQPGHRCDIAEGAPLNSAPAPVIQSQVNPGVPIQQASPQPAAATPTGTVRLNPPHGQPGHDCAVEVGKPLKN